MRTSVQSNPPPGAHARHSVHQINTEEPLPLEHGTTAPLTTCILRYYTKGPNDARSVHPKDPTKLHCRTHIAQHRARRFRRTPNLLQLSE